jgi:hypothetical protein
MVGVETQVRNSSCILVTESIVSKQTVSIPPSFTSLYFFIAKVKNEDENEIIFRFVHRRFFNRIGEFNFQNNFRQIFGLNQS